MRTSKIKFLSCMQDGLNPSSIGELSDRNETLKWLYNLLLSVPCSCFQMTWVTSLTSISSSEVACLQPPAEAGAGTSSGGLLWAVTLTAGFSLGTWICRVSGQLWSWQSLHCAASWPDLVLWSGSHLCHRHHYSPAHRDWILGSHWCLILTPGQPDWICSF